MKLAISLRTSMSRTVGRLLPLVGLALAACGGGGGAGLVGPTGPVRFDGPVYQAFTAFDGLADAAVDIYTLSSLGGAPNHIVPTEADGSFGIPQYLVTPDTLIIVTVRGGTGTSVGTLVRENLGAFHAVFTPEQVQAETAVVSFGTDALYQRMRHALATGLPRADVVTILHQRARCLLTADVDGDMDQDADDVASDALGAVDAMYPGIRDDSVSAIFAGDPHPTRALLPLTEPKQPTFLLSDETIAPGNTIGRSVGVGDRAYVCASSSVQVYRFDPREGQPLERIGTVGTTGEAQDLAVEGNTLFVLTFTHFEAYDITDLDAVTLHDSLQLATSPQGVQMTIVGSYAYLAMAGDGVRIVDLSNVDDLQEAASPFGGACFSVSSVGTTLFTGGEFAGTTVYGYDLTNPVAPALIGWSNHAATVRMPIALDAREATVVEIGKYSHCERFPNDFVFTQGSYDESTDSVTWPEDARRYGDLLVTSFQDATIEVLDVGDPRRPVHIPGIAPPPVMTMGSQPAVRTAAVTTYGLIGFQGSQVTVWSWDPLERPDPLFARVAPGVGVAARGLQLVGNRCHLGTNVGLEIHDLDDPTAPVARGHVAGGVSDEALVVGTTCYTGSSFGPLRIYDVANPDAPTYEGSITGDFRGLIARDGRLYAGRDSSFTVLDIANPLAPTVLGSLAMTVPSSIALFDDLAYVTDRYANGFVRVIDVTDPTNLTEVGTLGPRPLGGRPGLALKTGTNEMLVGGFNINSALGGRVSMVDTTDPANPIETGFVLTSGYRHNAVAVRHGFAYIASDGPILVIDIRDPRQPVWVDTVAMPRGWAVDIGDGYGAAAVDDWGLVTFRAAVRDVP